MNRAELRVRIRTRTYEAAMSLARVPDIDILPYTAKKVGSENFSVEGYVSREQVTRLQALGYGIEVLEDLSARDPRGEVSKTNRFEETLDRIRKKKGV